MSTINPDDPKWAKHIASQDFNLTDITGTPNTFSLSDIDSFYFLKSRSLIVFGIEIGLCIMLTVVLLLLTKPDKRRTVIFGLNIAGLILETIRFIATAINYNSQIFTVGVQFLGATAQLPGNINVATNVYSLATIFWYAVVETSLVLQVRVVFGAERKLQTLLTVGLGFLFTVTAGLKIGQQAMLFRAQLLQVAIVNNPAYDGINLAGRVLFAITVGISSAIFVAKLIYLIHRRQKMGFHAFGPLQVILIMATQCLLVPLAFFIADFYVNIDGFTTMGQTLLACSLPLSALWASSEAEKHTGIPVRPSFGNNITSTSTSAGTEVNSNKKSFFNFWRPGSVGRDGNEAEKGSFVSDSDHVMIQRTLHVAHSESPVPRSAGRVF